MRGILVRVSSLARSGVVCLYLAAGLRGGPVSGTLQPDSGDDQSVVFFPQIHADVSGSWFPCSVDSQSRARYFIASELGSEIFLLSAGDVFSWILRYEIQAGFGRQTGPIVFDPRDINYNIVPVLELCRWGYIVQTGLEHRCFHEIDRKLTPTIYWNMPYVAVGTATIRPGELGMADENDSGWDIRRRLAWSVSWGWFATRFFNVLKTNQINGGHRFRHHLAARARCVVLRISRWNVVAALDTDLWRNAKKTCWSQSVGLEGVFRRGEAGFAPFLRYHVDPLGPVPHFSRHRLWETGVQVFR
jgi:hypothetical protein